MSRRITMLMAVLGTFAAIGVTSASAMDEVTKADPPVTTCSSNGTDGGTSCNTPSTSSGGIVDNSLSGAVVLDIIRLPNNQTMYRCTNKKTDAGTKCPGQGQ